MNFPDEARNKIFMDNNPKGKEKIETEDTVKEEDLFKKDPDLLREDDDKPEDTETASASKSVDADDSEKNNEKPKTESEAHSADEKSVEASVPPEKKKNSFGIVRFLLGKRSMADAAAAMLILSSIFSLLLGLLWTQLPVKIFSVEKSSFPFELSFFALKLFMVYLLPVYICMKVYKLDSNIIMGRTKGHHPILIMSIVLISFPLSVFAAGLNNLFTYIFVKFQINIPLPHDYVAILGAGWPLILLSVLGFALVPAVLEEMYFRGIVQTALKSLGFKYRNFFLIFLPAFCYAIAKGSLHFFPAPFVLGVFLSLYRDKTESLSLCMIGKVSAALVFLFTQPLFPSFDIRTVILFPNEGAKMLLTGIIQTLSSGLVLIIFYRFIRNNLFPGPTKMKRLKKAYALPSAEKSSAARLLAAIFIFILSNLF